MPYRSQYITILLTWFVCCCSAAQAQSCTPAPPGLVSWWTGDTNENDIIGGNNPLAVQAVTLVPGEVGNGFTFGKDGYIQIPDATNLANRNFTWAAWAMPTGPGPNDDQVGSVIVEKNIDDVDDTLALTWRATDGRFLFFFGNSSAETITSTDSFQAGSFYFVAATYDGNTFQLFVNGVPEGSFTESKTVSYTSSDWEIGANDPIYFTLGYPRTWIGIIDEVQAYNVALSQSQIQAIYNGGAAGVCKGLTFSPTSLRFSRQTIGTTSPAKTVTATNSFPLPVTVKKVSTSGDFAPTNTCPVPPATLAAGAACTASVTFTPAATGARTGKLTFIDSAPSSPQKVNLTGSATDISLSVSRLNFGSHKVGTTSKAKAVTVTNDGTVTVNFTGSGIVIAGTGSTDYLISANTCGTSLVAGASCTVSVEFKPMATGTRSATLQFSDDGGESPQTVALTGTGA